MKRLSISLLLVILFMTIYVFCIGAYTFISGLNDIDLFKKKIPYKEDYSSRFKRIVEENTNAGKDSVMFSICCDRDEYLNSELKCVKMEVMEEDKMTLLFNTAVVDEDFSRSTIELYKTGVIYKVGELCPRDEMKVVTWSEEQPYSHYISQGDGHLLELSRDRKGIVSNFSTSSFCLDNVIGPKNSSIYVALLCPCMDKICVPKCCHEGAYYNTVDNSCKKESEDGIAPYKPKIPENTYQLIHNIPACDGPDSLIITADPQSPLSILENGVLMAMIDEKVTFDRKMYCVDKFSNGNDTASYVNGFFCPNTVLPIINAAVSAKKIDEIGFKSDMSLHSSSKYLHFDLFLMPLCLICVL